MATKDLFQDAGELSRPVFVLVAGPSGVGKSTFINIASGSDLTIGDDLNSCTRHIELPKLFKLSNRMVQLIDTPGFDDSEVSDTEILQRIALYLETMYREGSRLSGILYLHRISDVRVGGTARKSLRMLQQLCGEDRLQNIIIVTTWWGNVTKEIGDSREQQLGTSEALFKPLLDGGAQMVRYTDTFESAHDILGRVLRNQPSALRIQEELVDEGKDILETAAGIELARELALQAQRHKEELERIKEEMEEALSQKDVQSQKELEEAERDFEARMQKALHDRQTLSLEYSKKRDAELARKPSNDYVRATPSTERAEADVPLQLNPGNRQSSRPSTPNRSRWSRWPPWLKSLLPMLRKCFCLE